MVAVKPVYLLAGGIVAAALLYAVLRKPGQAGAAVAGAAWSLADGFIGEAGNLAGEAVGVPRTQAEQCAADRAAGRTWAASFSCPAGDFLKYVFN